MSHVKWLLGENIEEVASTLKEVEELVSTVLHYCCMFLGRRGLFKKN